MRTLCALILLFSLQSFSQSRDEVIRFCDENRGGGQQWIFQTHIQPGTHRLARADELDLYFSDLGQKVEVYKKIYFETDDIWGLSFLPNAQIRGLTFGPKLFKNEMSLDIESTEGLLLHPEYLKFYRMEKKEELYSLKDLQKNESRQVTEAYQLLGSDAVLLGLCGYTDPINAKECQRALRFLVSYAAPYPTLSKQEADAGIKKATTTIMLPQLYEQILSDSSYDESLRQLALVLINRFKEEQVPHHEYFFDLARTQFVKGGFSALEAEKRTWNLIGLLSTAGPNLGQRLKYFASSRYPQDRTSKLSLSVISRALPKLDQLALDRLGRLYVLPRQMTTFCDTGKPYHFWMSAYLSRLLVENGFSVHAAANAVFILQKGYQLKSTTIGRQPDRIFSEDLNSPWVQSMRMDINMAAAGVVFGAFSFKGKLEFNLDNQLWKMRDQFFPLDPLSPAQVRHLNSFLLGFPAWNRFHLLLMPDAVLKEYKGLAYRQLFMLF